MTSKVDIVVDRVLANVMKAVAGSNPNNTSDIMWNRYLSNSIRVLNISTEDNVQAMDELSVFNSIKANKKFQEGIDQYTKNMAINMVAFANNELKYTKQQEKNAEANRLYLEKTTIAREKAEADRKIKQEKLKKNKQHIMSSLKLKDRKIFEQLLKERI